VAIQPEKTADIQKLDNGKERGVAKKAGSIVNKFSPPP
jgi:hypothetical protein